MLAYGEHRGAAERLHPRRRERRRRRPPASTGSSRRIQWMQEIQIGGLGANAEYGGYTGGIINGVTKSGGNEFHGGVRVLLPARRRGPATTTRRPTTTSSSSPTRRSASAARWSGQAVVLRLRRVLAAGDDADRRRRHLGPRDPALPRQAHLAGQRRRTASCSWPSTTRCTNERRGISEFTLAEATSKQKAPGRDFALHWESLINANNFLNVKLTGYDGATTTCPTTAPTRRAASTTGTPRSSGTTRRSRSATTATIMTLDASWSLFADGLFGARRLPLLQVRRARTRTGGRPTSGCATAASPTTTTRRVCESSRRVLRRLRRAAPYFIEYGYGEYDAAPEVLRASPLYAQDSLRLDRFTVNVGAALRQLRRRLAERPRRLRRSTTSSFVDPRIGFVWDVFGDARTAVKVHWGRYHEKMFTYMFDREVSGQVVIPDQDCYWNDETAGLHRLRRADRSQLGTMGEVDHPYVDEIAAHLRAAARPGHDDRRRPHRPEVPRHHGDGQRQRRLRAVRTRPTTRSAAATCRSATCCSTPEFVLTTDNGGYRDYQAAMLRFEKRYSHGWQLRSSLVWTDLKGNILKNNGYEDEFQDRNGFTNADGQDGRRTASGSSSCPAPSTCRSSFRSSGQYTYLSGWYWTPYVRIRGLDYNAVDRQLHLLTERGSQQLPDRNLIDLRLAWSTKLGGTLGLTVSLECFNLMNEDTVLRVNGRWGDYRLVQRDAWTPSEHLRRRRRRSRRRGRSGPASASSSERRVARTPGRPSGRPGLSRGGDGPGAEAEACRALKLERDAMRTVSDARADPGGGGRRRRRPGARRGTSS